MSSTIRKKRKLRLIEAVRAYTIAGFCEAFGVGRSKTYLELKAGRLRAKKLGKKTLITEQEARRWLMALPEASRSAA